MVSSSEDLVVSMAQSIKISGNSLFEAITFLGRAATKNIDLGKLLADQISTVAAKWSSRSATYVQKNP
jgi:hypothetical protein